MANTWSPLAILLFLSMTTVLASASDSRRSLKTSGPCSGFGGKKRVALLVADPGGFSGNAEAKFYFTNLKSAVAEEEGSSVCAGRTFATLLGQHVIIVTTGIGPVTAALCVQELLQCRQYVSEIVYSGTSGWPVQLGGVLNADGKANPSKEVLRPGDVCVAPFAINWECQQTDWTQQCASWPNVDALPAFTLGPTADFLYGQCIFKASVKAGVHLSNEIYYAARSAVGRANEPKRGAKLLANEKNFFGNLTQGTGIKYNVAPDARIGIYDYRTCVEVDGQFFYSGVPWEMLSRDFAALALNQALNTTLTRRDVIAVSAMEAVGVAHAIERYNDLKSTVVKVPFTMVRANSDYLHVPVTPVKQGGTTTWRQIKYEQDFPTSYLYAIASFSHTVLTWLQLRCEALVAANKIKGPATSVCKFSIAYP